MGLDKKLTNNQGECGGEQDRASKTESRGWIAAWGTRRQHGGNGLASLSEKGREKARTNLGPGRNRYYKDPYWKKNTKDARGQIAAGGRPEIRKRTEQRLTF